MSSHPPSVLEVTEAHRKVHALRERKGVGPLAAMYLRGAEDLLDWILNTCPDGDLVDNASPLDRFDPSAYCLALMHRTELAATDQRPRTK